MRYQSPRRCPQHHHHSQSVEGVPATQMIVQVAPMDVPAAQMVVQAAPMGTELFHRMGMCLVALVGVQMLL